MLMHFTASICVQISATITMIVIIFDYTSDNALLSLTDFALQQLYFLSFTHSKCRPLEDTSVPLQGVNVWLLSMLTLTCMKLLNRDIYLINIKN